MQGALMRDARRVDVKCKTRMRWCATRDARGAMQDTLMHRCTMHDARCIDMLSSRYAVTLIRLYADALISRHADTLTRIYADTLPR
jgi:hypothetical protein